MVPDAGMSLRQQQNTTHAKLVMVGFMCRKLHTEIIMMTPMKQVISK